MMEIAPVSKARKRTCAAMVLARDAAKTIINCMESIIRSGCFEQVIVMLDTRSRDATGFILVEYARRFQQVQIIPTIWTVGGQPGDFADVRNRAISLFKTEYGFWLDADEELVDPGALRYMLTQPGKKAYSMYVVSPTGPRAPTFDMYQPRLFPVEPGVKFECAALERIDWSLRRNGIEIVQTNYRPILHTGYLNSRVVSEKNRRNERILAAGMKDPRLGLQQLTHILTQYESLRQYA